jgi:tryptophan halogenase
MRVSSIVVLGAGSAGLLTALTLKRKLPHLKIRVVRSPDIGIIAVGEGTTVVFARHLFEYLKVKPQQFYQEAQPTWKMGIRFKWGPRKEFVYTFSYEYEQRRSEMPRNNGFYYSNEQPWLGPASAFMLHDKVFPRRPDGLPMFHNNHAFHIENATFVGWLENRCREGGVEITDATVKAELGGEGIAALVSENGERITGDLFIDASGFRSELLGRALNEPFRSYADSLFCDRAVVGGWQRAKDEPILPYTTSETMDAGWCWRIDHEHLINRGYVYSSGFISDDAAREEFLFKNPKVSPDKTRVVKFRSGRYDRGWVGNVVGIGNAYGFVEPLEATSLQVICLEASTLADSLLDCLCETTPSMARLYNRYNNDQWDDIRNFLAIHYKFNTRIDTPFWRAVQADAKLHAAEEIVDWYQENGPSVLAGVTLVHSSNSYRMDGFMAILVGQNVPYQKIHQPAPAEQKFWQQYREQLAAQARDGMTSEQVLHAFRTPGLAWADPGAPQKPEGNGSRRSLRPGGVLVPVRPIQLGPTRGARPPAGQQ